MSRFNVDDPGCQSPERECAVEELVVPRTADIGGFTVHRALPAAGRRMVGPFIFWDQMGPSEFIVGQSIDVRPHPHIGLATVTYLFDGSIMHRDSLGEVVQIQPGEINLMTAGSGIVHSERTPPEVRERPSRLFGIQSWMALPKEKEEMDCAFVHHGRDALPELNAEGKRLRVILGDAYGLSSPVEVQSPSLYVDLELEAGAALPIDADTEERALYAVKGAFEVDGVAFPSMQMVVLRPGIDVTLRATEPTRLLLLGGAAADGPRHIWWNLVSSRRDRIEQAKDDWKHGRFPHIPNESEFIPLPEN